MCINNQTAFDEIQLNEISLQEKQKHIAKILNNDNYIEEMQNINNQINKSRTNKKVVDYKSLYKIIVGEESDDERC